MSTKQALGAVARLLSAYHLDPIGWHRGDLELIHKALSAAESADTLLGEAVRQFDHMRADLIEATTDEYGWTYYAPKPSLIFSNFVGAMVAWRATVEASPHPAPAVADDYAKAVADLAAQQGMTTEHVMRAAIRLYQAERMGSVEVVHKRDSSWLIAPAVAAEAGQREPHPHSLHGLVNAAGGTNLTGVHADSESLASACASVKNLRHQDEPVAEVAENFIFFLRKQEDGSRWPVGTKLYAATPAKPNGDARKFDSTGAMACAWFGTAAPEAVERVFGAAPAVAAEAGQGEREAAIKRAWAMTLCGAGGKSYDAAESIVSQVWQTLPGATQPAPPSQGQWWNEDQIADACLVADIHDGTYEALMVALRESAPTQPPAEGGAE